MHGSSRLDGKGSAKKKGGRTGRFMKAISLSCDAQNKTRELQHQIKASGQLASKLNYFETKQNPVP